MLLEFSYVSAFLSYIQWQLLIIGHFSVRWRVLANVRCTFGNPLIEQKYENINWNITQYLTEKWLKCILCLLGKSYETNSSKFLKHPKIFSENSKSFGRTWRCFFTNFDNFIFRNIFRKSSINFRKIFDNHSFISTCFLQFMLLGLKLSGITVQFNETRVTKLLSARLVPNTDWYLAKNFGILSEKG